VLAVIESLATDSQSTREGGKSRQLAGSFLRAGDRTRTGDPLFTRQALYQLSYSGECAVLQDSWWIPAPARCWRDHLVTTFLRRGRPGDHRKEDPGGRAIRTAPSIIGHPSLRLQSPRWTLDKPWTEAWSRYSRACSRHDGRCRIKSGCGSVLKFWTKRLRKRSGSKPHSPSSPRIAWSAEGGIGFAPDSGGVGDRLEASVCTTWDFGRPNQTLHGLINGSPLLAARLNVGDGLYTTRGLEPRDCIPGC
jgi:hypothetical protein